jgi:acetyl esterase/lipase
MLAPPVFTDDDLADLKRAKSWLARMPRVRMLTAPSRAIAHAVTVIAVHVVRPAIRRTGVRIETRTVKALGREVAVRILRPAGTVRGVHLDVHGGGWCTGTAEINDRPNVALAKDCQVAVVSVDYRRAPLCGISEIVDDCETAAAWLSAHARDEFGAGAITIGGDSAGAHLAACTLLRQPLPFRAALLNYGIYDLSGSEAFRRAPHDTLIFHGPTMLACLHKLTEERSDEERRDPAISPAFADLKGLPPVLMVSGAADPLIDESRKLHARWQAANGNSELLVVPEAPHAFNRLPIAVARKTEAYAHAWLKRHLPAVSQ